MFPTPFMGNSSEVFKLANGVIGEIVAEYEYMYEYYPTVTVCPANSMMIVKDKRLSIRILANAAPNPVPNIAPPPQSANVRQG